MTPDWFERRTHRWQDWSLEQLLAAKKGTTVSLVVPARNEAATVGDVVTRVRDALVDTVALLDEVVVIDSDSTDDTFNVATDAGARVFRSAEIRPDLGSVPGKGEAMWKSLFVTSGELLVFMDADLLDWDTHFVPGLLGPLLTDPSVSLVKGFYERPGLGRLDHRGELDRGGELDHRGDLDHRGRLDHRGELDHPEAAFEGGRVTELVARPLVAIAFPELAGLVQPLAGEWAVRRSLFASLNVPTGYAVELAALIDTASSLGVDAIAQVDLGRRAHRHQALRDLGAMAVQILAAAGMRGLAPEDVVDAEVEAVESASGSRQARPPETARQSVELVQYAPCGDDRAKAVVREVPIGERPPAVSVGVEA